MLSIIINHYKSPEVLRLCLGYLKQNAPQDAEIIVADSETIEETELMMRYDFPEVIFIAAKENIGFAKSVNKGLKRARGDYMLVINADVVISDKNAIPALIEYMKKNDDIGMLGPRLLSINDEHQPSCFRFYSPKTILARRTPFGKTPWGKKELARFLIDNKILIQNKDDRLNSVYTFVDWLMGSALLVRRKAYEQAGGLCENYFMYMEDVDWCRTFWEKGWKVAYYPQAFFYHYHFQASKKRGAIFDVLANKYARVHILSAIKYFRKYGLRVPKYGI